ncbi:hypothetical protein, conserved [Plasmodium gonderi]|uniref:Uncharacterized protein n=1 Tax=Plasmodium gonderi TaxID=77519 RepID=A0A1Y1JAM4_PLAGO|nr:hypothetical protein, conserved [Plasmodium gonderi]GAW79310.1 hypothetical protein, conserved [Plasmodium gonderi]
MLRENLIEERTKKDGINIFIFNNYAIWILKLSHVCFFFFLSIRNLFHLSSDVAFLIFFLGFFIILFFFFMSWYSCYLYIRSVTNEELIDEEVNPSILNEIIPQIFFSLCSFFLINLLYSGYLLVYLNVQADDSISIPLESVIIFFFFFFCYILYGTLFKYENSMSAFLHGANGIGTLALFIYKSGIYLVYLIQRHKQNKLFYRDSEGDYVKMLMYSCASAFSSLLLKNLNLINLQLLSFLMLVSSVIFIYSELNLQKMEFLHESIGSRIMHMYLSSLHSSSKTPGKLS